MTCDERREWLALWVDGEERDADRAGLYAHLESCPECRAFLEAQIEFRALARRDRESLARAAAERLPERAPVAPPRRRPAPARERARAPWLTAWLRAALPAPAALALATLILVAGVALGAAIGLRAGRAPVPAVPARPATVDPAAPGPGVIYVCSLPEVEVRAALPRP